MSSLWNLLSPFRLGRIKLAGSGNELFGTVIQHGINPKTVRVRVHSRIWINKYKIFRNAYKDKQVHDEHNYCVTGDRVVIKSCEKLSPTKAFFVKSIVRSFPRAEQTSK